MDRALRRRTVRVKISRAVVAFDRRDGSAGLQQPLERSQRADGIAQMLENEAHEDVVKAARRKRKIENVGLEERHIADTGARDTGLRRLQ